MTVTQATSNGVQQNGSDVSGNDGSKFKRFLKRFGRHPSDDAHGQSSDSAHPISAAREHNLAAHNGADSTNDNGRIFGSSRQRKESKPKSGSGSTKGKRGDASLAGRFFQQSNNPPALPRGNSTAQQSTASTPGAEKTVKAAFNDTTSVGGLANTLALPSGQMSPPPQLSGLPQHDPIATGELMRVSGSSSPPPSAAQRIESDFTKASQVVQTQDGKVYGAEPVPAQMYSNGKDVVDQSMRNNTQTENDQNVMHALSPQSSYGSSRSARVRDSVDNRTVDTNKSRASTKPTTLMSLDTRENVQGHTYAPLAQIAQHRVGDQSVTSNSYYRSNVGRIPSDGSAVPTAAQNQSAIQFASAPAMGRTASGTIIQLPGQNDAPEDEPFTNVPSMSRPHPANNPHPGGVPADNASMLTLASSTAAMSIGGGAASSRGHSHAAPSFGGARSIGGSLMGERRNSSDTYASVKALPPLSRRGSDASARTGMSVAASATGLNSAQAMLAHVAPSTTTTGPGAPGDRVSIHRTPSQRTVATQLSIPLSNSTHALPGTHADGARAATPEPTPALSTLLAAPPTAPSAALAASLPVAVDSDASRGTTEPYNSAAPAASDASIPVPSILTSQVSTDGAFDPGAKTSHVAA